METQKLFKGNPDFSFYKHADLEKLDLPTLKN